MNNIEVELRSFISEEQYRLLLDFFYKNAKFVKEDSQETYYFDSKEDIRIQRNNFFSKIWFKKGKLHDEAREEIEIKFDGNDFENLERVFLAIGLNVQIKWFRKRKDFFWKDIKVSIDYTKGYGYIIEFEKMASEENKEAVLSELKEKFAELSIPITPKEEFDQRYQHYKQNWKELTMDKA